VLGTVVVVPSTTAMVMMPMSVAGADVVAEDVVAADAATPEAMPDGDGMNSSRKIRRTRKARVNTLEQGQILV
jgi:hypothetical protein